MPSDALRSFCAIAGSSSRDGSRSGSIASSVFSSRKYSGPFVHGGRLKGVNRLASWSSLWIARSASAVPTASSGICNSLPSQRSRFRKRRCWSREPDKMLWTSSMTSNRTLVARSIRIAMSCLAGTRSLLRSGAPSASSTAEKNRRSSGAAGICTFSTGTATAPQPGSEPGMCARLNFSTIMVLPLLVGPTSSRFGIRVRFGNVSRSSIAAKAASARA